MILLWCWCFFMIQVYLSGSLIPRTESLMDHWRGNKSPYQVLAHRARNTCQLLALVYTASVCFLLLLMWLIRKESERDCRKKKKTQQNSPLDGLKVACFSPCHGPKEQFCYITVVVVRIYLQTECLVTFNFPLYKAWKLFWILWTKPGLIFPKLIFVLC